MADITREIIIKNKMEDIVGRINVKNTILHGHCEWYDGRGNLVAYGYFNHGVPFTGTFLNWTNFLTELPMEKAFDVEMYCQDWVSRFESYFRSESPKYEIVIETYYIGLKISP